MSSDKISELLEKQLKTLGQQIRIEILKKLNAFDKPISFSRLQKEISRSPSNSTNFSFHLKTLKKTKYINLGPNGYSITPFGRKILKKVVSIEQLLNEQNCTLMIRTSKYSKEPFDVKKIEEFLIKEGEMERFLAKKIAEEVKKRLSETNIEYLTAPLMREYICAVLIEHGLELVRKKLTRLGTPPYEVFKMFDSSKNSEISPSGFIQSLGSDASEEFLLLNLLPSDLADMYLSGEVVLLNLNTWALRPLSLYLQSETWKSSISKFYSISASEVHSSIDHVNYFLKSLQILNKFSSFFSEDILLGSFNQLYLSDITHPNLNKRKKLIDFLVSQIIDFNSKFSNGVPHLSLEFNYKNPVQQENDLLFFSNLKENYSERWNKFSPFLFLDYSIFKCENINLEQLNKSINPLLLDNIVFFNPNKVSLLNSAFIKIKNLRKNTIILDKILINTFNCHGS